MDKLAHQSKTIWFGVALIVLDLIPQIQDLLLQVAPEFMAQYGLTIIGIIIVVLRFLTNMTVVLKR